jgi:hypothetical protein
VHELEKISFTVTDIAAAAPGGVTYLKIAADYDADGKADIGYLRLACSGGSTPEILAWSWGVSNSGSAHTGTGLGHGRVAPGAPKEWNPASPQLRALTASYLHKKLNKRMNADAGGWTRVSLSGGEGLCPAIDAVKATKSRSNIQNN